MTFANVSGNREQLVLLSQLQLTAFPGCTIHQSCDPMRAIQHLSTRQVDAVFADADTYAVLIGILRKQKRNTPIYLLDRKENRHSEEPGGILNIVTYPVTKQKLQIALQSIPREIREVI